MTPSMVTQARDSNWSILLISATSISPGPGKCQESDKKGWGDRRENSTYHPGEPTSGGTA